jgi:xylan 1,4-beta-xylosidase
MNLKIRFLMLILLTSIATQAQYQITGNTLESGFYMNPIFAGDYPDPSILREENTYYMVHSSFEYYPGLLIWKSKDLINWEPVTHALHQYVGSVWAPDLVKYNGRYYIYFPASNTNYVVWADKVEGPWSEPIELAVNMIDPGHVTDEKGNRYLYFSSGAYVPLSNDGLSIAGEIIHSYNGWPIPREWSIECFCMESPKLFKRGEYYYLTVAQGGTAGPATGHMVISARSKSHFGPWENSPHNPIIRTQDPSERWWSVGHATIFDDTSGDWWMMFHGYENAYYNKGRQTLLLPVEWTADGWYKIPENTNLNQVVKRPNLTVSETNYNLNDDFKGKILKPTWAFFEGYDAKRLQMSGNGVRISGKGTNIANSSPLLTVPLGQDYIAQVELEIEGNAIGGLVLFYNEQASSGILANHKSILANLRGWQFETEPNKIDRKVALKIKNIHHAVDMFYSTDGNNWHKIENSLEVSGLHHNVLSGFMSLRIGLCSIGEGAVTFKKFTYEPVN